MGAIKEFMCEVAEAMGEDDIMSPKVQRQSRKCMMEFADLVRQSATPTLKPGTLAHQEAMDEYFVRFREKMDRKLRLKETKQMNRKIPKWFVHGHCDKEEDIAYVVESTGPTNAACQVAVEMGRVVMEYPNKPPHRVYLVLPGMKASDLADELRNNMGSPRRSYEVTVTPFQMNENLM